MDENMTDGINIGEGIEENQHAELEIVKARLRTADTIVDNYSNPTVRSMINAIKVVAPFFGDLIDESLCATFENNQKKKREQLLDIVLSDKQSITPDMVNDVEFIVNFTRVMEAVNRLARNEKVRYFANLIKNGYLVTGAAQPGLSVKNLQDIPIITVSIEKQNRFINSKEELSRLVTASTESKSQMSSYTKDELKKKRGIIIEDSGDIKKIVKMKAGETP